MSGYSNTVARLAESLGLREPSTWERLQRIDWREYAPARPAFDYRITNDRYDATSLIVGIAVGVGVGIAIGMAAKGNVAPAARRVRERATEAIGDIQSRLPERLRVTRMEEEPASSAS